VCQHGQVLTAWVAGLLVAATSPAVTLAALLAAFARRQFFPVAVCILAATKVSVD